jgi:glutamate dehydrogenase
VEVALPDDPNGEAEAGRLKAYQPTRPLLTDLLPVIDNFGLRVFDATLTEVRPDLRPCSWIVTFRTQGLARDGVRSPELEERVLGGLRSALNGRIEDDSLNRLVLAADLEWRDVQLLRAYLAYAKQLGHGLQKRHASDVLVAHPRATRALIALFRARFAPDLGDGRAEAERAALAHLQGHRRPIKTYHADRVFGVLSNLIQSTTRTNFFSPRARELDALAFKIDPRGLERVPAPVPFAEIFVHAPDMTGVHLRGGPLARGGIRWSDRPEDFRTEILHLMKTQMVKNGLIVPAGAKGGFVLKRRVGTAAAMRAEADHQYERFMRCLLSLTDNFVGQGVEPPPGVIRHDGDDPYLVVAPDKGTAHLSDVANRVAAREGFWLGDAFASGGSEGYDHKKEGITARGAWLCARRHFREMGVDIDRSCYTVAGIGDMSGDVFGNGMLLARNARLIAAFNHAHVFLDPDPDPETAWNERKRLFNLGTSSWTDYDPAKISEGGGVFERSAKSIALPPRAREVLHVEEAALSGEELVRAILRMPVDLLWNGGIGTYVKASAESGAEIGDRANAGVRVDASELRARVVCEGGNLGLTQAARVEFARRGGRLNTDAIDNSGGVDLSDHEVNLKVLLDAGPPDRALSPGERSRWLRTCLDDACETVLGHCATQSRCISMDLLRSREDPERMLGAAQFLSRQGGLDWRLEHLPSREVLRSRTSPSGERLGYTRPELAVLLGYSKVLVKRSIVESDLPDRPAFASVLLGYFPEALREAFGPRIHAHRLRREIIATALTNRVVDGAGVTLVPELVRHARASIPDVVVAYDTADRLLEADGLRRSIEEQPIDEAERLRAWILVEGALRDGARLRFGAEGRPGLEPEEIARWTALVGSLREALWTCMGPTERARVEETSRELETAGFSGEVARRLAALPSLVRAFGVVSLTVQSGEPLAGVAQLHARVGEETRIAWMLDRLARAGHSEGWERVACEALYVEMLEAQRQLTERLLAAGVAAGAARLFDESCSGQLREIADMVAQIDAESSVGLGALTVLSRQIRALC